MLLKFKNGYTVTTTNDASKSYQELRLEALRALDSVKQYKRKKVRDAELAKKVNLNTSFRIEPLIKALKTLEDLDASASEIKEANMVFKSEYARLFRDLNADASKKNENYPSRYGKDTLLSIINKYQSAATKLRKIGYDGVATDIENYISKIKANWKMNDSVRKLKDVPYYDPTETITLESSYSPENIKKEIRYAGNKYGEPRPESQQRLQEELELVMFELDDLISKGESYLAKQGISKDQARAFIDRKYIHGTDGYTTILQELRRNKLSKEANELSRKIRELQRAWHLII